jgi:hypothetical protein
MLVLQRTSATLFCLIGALLTLGGIARAQSSTSPSVNPTRLIKAVFDSLRVPPKGPYESASEYRARIRSRVDTTKLHRVPIQLQQNEDTFCSPSMTYNPEKETWFVVLGISQGMIKVGHRYYSDRPIACVDVSLGKYRGENAFGASIAVSKTRRTIYAIAHPAFSTFEFPMKRQVAQIVGKRLRLYASFRVRPNDLGSALDSFTTRFEPKIDAPFDETAVHYVVTAGSLSIQFVNGGTGEIVGTFDVPSCEPPRSTSSNNIYGVKEDCQLEKEERGDSLSKDSLAFFEKRRKSRFALATGHHWP